MSKNLCVAFYAGILTSFMLPANVDAQTTNSVPDLQDYRNKLGNRQLLFTENAGQVMDAEGNPRRDVLFTAYSNGTKVFLTATGIYYQFEKAIFPEGYEPRLQKRGNRKLQVALTARVTKETYRFSVLLQGGSPAPQIRKEMQQAYTENFYLANCAIAGVHTYQRLVYGNVYPGIDWVIYSNGQHLEYDFIVRPGADPAQIKLKVNDAKKVSIAADGGLVMTTDLGEVKEAAPVSYSGGAQVATNFKQREDGTITFTPAAFDKTKELRIDPSVVWATYYGGDSTDVAIACTVDAAGDIYVAGYSGSLTGIAAGGFQSNPGGNSDAILVKFSSTGARLWATYYGGVNLDVAFSCAVDASNNVYMAGYTQSPAGIASGGFQNTYGAGYADAYLVKFTGGGARIWATYYGGDDDDEGASCVTDASGNVYLSGFTASPSGIAFNGHQNNIGSTDGTLDAFLVKFNSSGDRIWGTYYGGTEEEYDNFPCAVDAAGNVYLHGSTPSETGIASGGFQNTFGGGYQDDFLVKFNSSGTRIWATYYGGEDIEFSGFCKTDGSGNVYIGGNTASATGIASGGFKNTISTDSDDAFVVKFNSDGQRLWGTYFGSNNVDIAYAGAVDAMGNLYVSGLTKSTTNIASGGIQGTYGGGLWDAFLVKFASSGARVWATYYGGTGNDDGSFCATDASGNVYLGGATQSRAGIASGGFQNSFGGGFFDGYLVKISDAAVLPLTLVEFSGKSVSGIDALLTWRTANEVNLSHFELQKSVEGRYFSTRATLPAKGTTGSEAVYNYTDKNLAPGQYYYRLRTVDKDAKESISSTVALQFKGNELLTVYPVPAQKYIYLSGSGNMIGKTAQLFDMQGKLVRNIRISEWPQRMELPALMPGNYQIRLDGTMLRFIKQ